MHASGVNGVRSVSHGRSFSRVFNRHKNPTMHLCRKLGQELYDENLRHLDISKASVIQFLVFEKCFILILIKFCYFTSSFVPIIENKSKWHRAWKVLEFDCWFGKCLIFRFALKTSHFPGKVLENDSSDIEKWKLCVCVFNMLFLTFSVHFFRICFVFSFNYFE